MGDSCGNCRSREEEIFWTHFQCIHFSQSLRGDFLRRLEIPEKFAKHMMKKLPETVTVKGPSGLIWDLGLTAYDETLFFEGGWKNFVLDHSLEENDLLIFKYNGLSHFDVLMFEGRSLCEKASSYFVKKCVHKESDNGYQTKRKIDENDVEIVHNSSQGGLESSPEKSTNNIHTTPLTQPIKSATTNKRGQRAGSSANSLHARHLRGKELNTFDGEVEVEIAFDGTRIDEDEFSPHPSCFEAPLTQFEKANVFLKAQEALTKDGFMVVMKPTHVWKRFYMAFPIAWTAKHFLRENMDVILRINERTWRTRFIYHKGRDCGGLSGGWKSFASDNNLIEHDVCVFEPSDMERKPIVLDVRIFRVLDAPVQAPVPLTMHPASESTS
ncbi:AP2/B3-like transcriptional factor family protein, putative isoform 2 [Hibiscus syriacus]|uniref:AP2/B3-like transcriptional factor family protein, putative isoform 2 n=1 Tax=Hibiscus syriacus TaxID=106335 RepID=A0A6A2WK53_HIBSY|nr:B3 domain-containing protein REM16-like [Hibiscus syriacus]KAE8659071.1 AP2/B3-like transcriptional factor family protein, putative isoform 2 [Hibiscus syriacus]